MSAMQRTKGAAFERRICTMLRARLIDATIRRGKQSHLADDPDVVIMGAGEPWDRIWFELQDARHTTTSEKLAQAWNDSGAPMSGRIPIAVTHRLGARAINATLYWEHARWLFDDVLPGPITAESYTLEVTMDFEALLGRLP